jgi:hypothetical protein
MGSVDERAVAIGRDQHGLATRGQLATAGIAGRTVTRRVRAGVWREPAPGVIDLGTHPASWQQAARRLLLAAGDGAVLSHRTAAHLHGMVDCRRPGRIDVLVARGRHDEAAGARLHTTVRLHADERSLVDGLPVTGEARTLVDLAGLLDDAHLELVARDLARRRPALSAEVLVLADRRRGAPGLARLRRVLDALPLGIELAESPLEAEALALLARVGVPAPAVQHEVTDDQGRFVHRADLAWPSRRVLLAVDGRAWHDTPARRERDAAQRARLTELGWTVVVAHAEDLRGHRADALVARLRSLGIDTTDAAT